MAGVWYGNCTIQGKTMDGKEEKQMALVGIDIRHEERVYRVPADLVEGFELVPDPKGDMTLTFWDWSRMLECLENHGYAPSENLRPRG